MAKTASSATPDAPAKTARTARPRKAAAAKPISDGTTKPRAKKTKTGAPAPTPVPAPTKAPRKAKSRSTPHLIDARRLALAAEFRAEIELYTRAFDESLDCAIDRLVAEHDELDRIIGDILALAAEAKELRQAA